jgi:hypoxanthine phosphoribosyltransferase
MKSLRGPTTSTFAALYRMRVLLTEDQIREGVGRLAREIAARYAARPVTLVAVLTGSLVLVADLIRRLGLPLRVGLVQSRSYRGGATTPGALEINQSMLPDLAGRHVLLVDDIFDTGRTLAELVGRVEALGAASVATAVLLVKQGRQEVTYRPNFVAFEIPDAFVVGYGLDYNDLYRNLPYVAALDETELA